MNGKRNANRGYLFLALFGMPFLIAGCILGGLATNMIITDLNARRWTQAQATIRQVNLERHSGSKGSTTYSVTATYTYSFNGREYESNRVGLSFGSDNIGSWQQDTYARLAAARRAGRTVPCFVNPARPSEALLDRDLRFWELFFLLLFPALFGGVGAGLVIGGIAAYRQARRRRIAENTLPADEDKPWLTDLRWASGIIRSNTAAKAAWISIAAVYWSLVWLPVLLFLPRELSKGDRLALIALICPFIGLLLIVWAARSIIRNRKYGRSCFQCKPLPGVIGGHLRGELLLEGDITTLEEIELTLRCRNTVTTKRGRETNTQTNTLWESRQTLAPGAVRFGESEMRLPVDFQIPGSCRPTDDSNSSDKVSWQLQVRGAAVGVDLALDFEVPVFRTKDSPPDRGTSDPTLSIEPTPEEAQAVAAPTPPPSCRIRREQDAAGRTVFAGSAWPGISVPIVIFVFALPFSGVAVFAGTQLLKGEWFLALFMIVFGLASLVLWLVFFSFFGSYRVAVEPDGLETQRRYGLLTLRQTIPAHDIAGFSFKECASSGNRKWYAVSVQSTAGKKTTVASMIESPTAAKWLIRQLEECITAATSGRSA